MVWRNYDDIIKNLNANSTHPNPWRPPVPFEIMTRSYTPLMIRTPLVPKYTPNKTTSISTQPVEMMGYGAWIGFKIGIFLTASDVILINRTTCPKQILARFAYIAPVYMSLPVAYIATREIFSTFASDKDHRWPYYSAVVAPAAVWSCYKGNLGAFGRFALPGMAAAAIYKRYSENDFISRVDDMGRFGEALTRLTSHKQLSMRDDPVRGHAVKRNLWSDHYVWKGQAPLSGANEVEPGWKQFLSEEDKKKGPPQGQ